MTINMAIYDFLKNIMLNVDKSLPVCSIFCDMTQAFDYVDHKTLIDKLNHYGIRGRTLKLIESFLINVVFCTEFHKEVSWDHFYIYYTSMIYLNQLRNQ